MAWSFREDFIIRIENILTKWSGKLDFLMEFPFPLIPRNSTFPFPIVWNAILNSSFQLSGIGWVIPFPWIQKIIPAHPWFAHPLEVAIEQLSPSSQLVKVDIMNILKSLANFTIFSLSQDRHRSRWSRHGREASRWQRLRSPNQTSWLSERFWLDSTPRGISDDDLSTMTVLQSS